MNVELVEERINGSTIKLVPYGTTEEELYRGILPNDPIRLTPEQERRRIIDMMRQAGVEVDDDEEFEVHYNGVDDYDDSLGMEITVTKKGKERLDDSDDVVYEEEVTKEEIYTGEWINDPIRLTPEQEREKIIEMMRRDGIEIEDDAEIEYGFEGVDNFEDGFSSQVVVRKVERKLVPYKITKEEIYTGEWINDLIRLTPEQERDRIIATMRQDGVEIEDDADIEYGFEGVDNFEDGFSSQIVVYKKGKVPFTHMFIDMNAPRPNPELDNINEIETRNVDALNNLYEDTDRLESTITDANGMTVEIREEIEKIDKEIKEIRERLKVATKDYEDSFARMQEMVSEKNVKLEELGILTDEELLEFSEDYAERQLIESQKARQIRENIELEKRQLSALVRRKNKAQKEVLNAEALGLSVSEYREITSTMRKKNLVNAILESKGLEEIVQKPYAERTKEERDKLKEVKAEIEKEIANVKNQDRDKSVLDAVVSLYCIDPEVFHLEDQRKIKVPSTALAIIPSVAQQLPERVVNHAKVKTYTPGAAPKDMAEVMENRESQVRVFGEDDFSEGYIEGTDIRKPRYRGENETEEEYVQFLEEYYGHYFPEEKKEEVKEEVVQEEIEPEEVFTGNIILDGLNREKTSDEIAYEMMQQAGIEKDDNYDYWVGYKGVEDEYGMSDTQSSDFTI